MKIADREAHDKRVERAKRVTALVVTYLNGPRGALVPSDIKGAFADLCMLMVELAQLSHAQFDLHPFDIGQLTQRVDKLDGLTGRDNSDG